MKTPIEMMIDGIQWHPVTPLDERCGNGDGVPYATHEGLLKIGDLEIECFRLSTGEAVISEAGLLKFFEFMNGQTATAHDEARERIAKSLRNGARISRD